MGFVGLAAALAGYHTTITDYDATAVRAHVIQCAPHGPFPCRRERARLATTGGRTLSVVMALSEILYEDRNHEMLLDVLNERLLPGGVAWFGDGGRVQRQRFINLARVAGYTLTLRDELGNELGVHHEPVSMAHRVATTGMIQLAGASAGVAAGASAGTSNS